MIDPNNMPEVELNLLKEVAKAKGQTLEEALADLGHQVAPKEDATVTLDAAKPEPKAAEPQEPVQVEAPIDVPREPPSGPQDEFAYEVMEEIEPPPPPAADEDPEDEDEDEEQYEDEPEEEDGVKRVCAQCGWDQDVPIIPEPEHHDKIAFLQAVLGQKVFNKRYKMFGGKLRVTFRTLTVREIDVLYQEAFNAQKEGLIQTQADYYEYLNRLRLYLQLTGFSAQDQALHIKLPEGFSPETHSKAVSYWSTKFEKEGQVEGQTLMQQVQDYIIDNVLKTEHLQRAITHECSKFNRLVAKLEACVDSPDFWNETEPQS